MRLRPTALGWKGLLLLAALELAFLATAYSNLFFLLLVFCGALGGLGACGALFAVRGLAISRLELPLAAAGSARPVVVDVDAGQRSRFAVEVALVLAEETVPVAVAASLGGAQRVAGVLPARPRGVQAVRAVRLTTRQPFGLFAASVDLPVTAELVTHPAPATGPHAVAGVGDAAGTPHPAPGRAAAVVGLRAFRAGDGLGDVHWRATARRGAPIAKEREPDSGPGRDVVVDRRCGADDLERALAAATDLVLARPGDDAPARLLSQGATFRLGGGPPRAALRWLAAAGPLPGDAPAPPSPPGAIVLPPPQPAQVRP